LQYGLGGHRDLPMIRELLPSIQAEARDILLACQRMRLARLEERYRLPKWVSYAIREAEQVDVGRISGDTVSWIDNIPVLAEKIVGECQRARGLGERSRDIEQLTGILDLCTYAGQRIQEIIMQGLPPKEHKQVIFELVREVVNKLDDTENGDDQT